MSTSKHKCALTRANELAARAFTIQGVHEMLSIGINVQERNPRLGTSKGQVTIKQKGSHPLVIKFEASPHQVLVKGDGGDRIFPRMADAPGQRSTSLYAAVAKAAVQLWCDSNSIRISQDMNRVSMKNLQDVSSMERLLATFE